MLPGRRPCCTAGGGCIMAGGRAIIGCGAGAAGAGVAAVIITGGASILLAQAASRRVAETLATILPIVSFFDIFLLRYAQRPDRAGEALCKRVAPLFTPFKISPNQNRAATLTKLRNGDYWIKGDHAGSDASPGDSTRRSLRPVMSIDHTCDPPPLPPRASKVRVNMITRPFGAQVGPSSCQPLVNMRSPEPSGRMTPT